MYHEKANKIPQHKIKILPYRWDLYKHYFKADMVGAEIGVAQGQNAINIWQFSKPKKLHLVDPWNYGGYLHAFGGVFPRVDKQRPEIDLYRSTFDNWHDYVKDIFAEEIQNDRVELHKTTGQEWLDQQEANSLDFVYCDALKQPGEIESFLDRSMKVLKTGGLFCGHDWHNWQQCNNLTYNVHAPLLDAIQDRKIKLLALSTDQNLPPSFVCRVNE